MFVSCPKTAFTVLGFFVVLTFVDIGFRFSFFSVSSAVCNTGIGLGIDAPRVIIWLAISLTLIFAFSQSLKRPQTKENVAWGAIFTGGVINAIDRYVHGCVTDYIQPLFFPSFNLADIMIFLGVVALGLSLLGISLKAKSYAS